MNHEKFERMVMRKADNELPKSQEAELSAHLRACPSCAAYTKEFGILESLLTPLKTEPEVASHLTQRLMQYALASEQKPQNLLERIRLLFIGPEPVLRYAAVALLIGAFLGGAGFRFQEHEHKKGAVAAITSEEESLFSAVYPGSVTESARDLR